MSNDRLEAIEARLAAIEKRLSILERTPNKEYIAVPQWPAPQPAGGYFCPLCNRQHLPGDRCPGYIVTCATAHPLTHDLGPEGEV